MAVLEILHHRTGTVETRELTKEAPLLVGRLPTSDIRIAADGVAPIHCRISWKRTSFEVAAVTEEGVHYNGTKVHKSRLAPGDVVRVADVDIILLAEPQQPAA